MSNDNLSERVEELEAEVKELWDRIKQMENVLTTAFRIVAEGGNPTKKL